MEKKLKVNDTEATIKDRYKAKGLKRLDIERALGKSGTAITHAIQGEPGLHKLRAKIIDYINSVSI